MFNTPILFFGDCRKRLFAAFFIPFISFCNFIANSYICGKLKGMTVEIYKALEKRIKAFFAADNVELYSYQDRDLAENPLYHAENWLIEFLPITWNNNQTLGAQSGDLQFIIHHLTHTGYADQKRIINTTHFVKHQELMKCLHNWSCTLQYVGINAADTLINRVTRLQSEHEHQLSNLIVSRHRFGCQIFDYSAMKQYQQILATIRLEMWLAENTSDNDKTDSVIVVGNGD